jgi:hypothetical protein
MAVRCISSIARPRKYVKFQWGGERGIFCRKVQLDWEGLKTGRRFPPISSNPARVYYKFIRPLQCRRNKSSFVCDHRAESVGCQLSQRSHRPDACSLHQWLLTSRIWTPFALLQLLVFLPQEPFVHARTQRRFEDRDSQRAFALLDGPIGQDDNPFPLPCAHVPG